MHQISSVLRHLACCGKYVHDRCQKQWETVSNTCAHFKQPPTLQEHQEEPIEEPQRLLAREALRLYRDNSDEIRSGMNVSACFVNHAIMHYSSPLNFPWSSLVKTDHVVPSRAGTIRQLLVFSVKPFKIDQNKKAKPLNRLCTESRKRKKVDIQRLSARFRSQQFFLWKICGETFSSNL